MDDYSKWPVSRQLALKMLADPNNFDRVLINQIRGRDENAIDLPDVVKWLRMA